MAKLASCWMALFIAASALLFLSVAGERRHPVFGNRKERLTHLHFYFHDILSGSSPSALAIVGNQTSTEFGTTIVIDDPLTERPEPTSKLLGRAQGLYAFTSQHDQGLLMAMNFYFVAGKYNGSSLAIMGRNNIRLNVREMPIIGGSGIFRWARGYVQAHTIWADDTTGDALVEYNVYVLHY